MSTLVLTVGTFDLLHPGHLALFRGSRQVRPGAPVHLTVGVNTDRFVTEYKGAAPVMPYPDRAALVASLRDVDQVISNDSPTLVPMITALRPDFLTIGADWAQRDYAAQIGVDEAGLTALGVTLVYVPLYEGRSSTNLRNRAGAGQR